MNNDTRIELRIPSEMKTRLDEAAERQMVSMSDVVRWAIRDWLEANTAQEVRAGEGNPPAKERGKRRGSGGPGVEPRAAI